MRSLNFVAENEKKTVFFNFKIESAYNSISNLYFDNVIIFDFATTLNNAYE